MKRVVINWRGIVQYATRLNDTTAVKKMLFVSFIHLFIHHRYYFKIVAMNKITK